jgi:hypothetical protein
MIRRRGGPEYKVHRGEIVEFEFFWDHAEALEAAGLRE